MKIQAEINGAQSPLSKRENEVFALLAEGLSQKEMSDHLHRSLPTISTHIEHIKQKLDATNSLQAVSIAVLKGFLSFKNLMVYGLVVSSLAGLLAPSQSYAADGDQQPLVRVRVRGSGRLRSGGKLQLRTATRKKEG